CDGGGEPILLDAVRQLPVFKKSIPALQKRVVDDETGLRPIAMPNPPPEGSSEKHHEWNQSRKPGEQAGARPERLVDIRHFPAAGKKEFDSVPFQSHAEGGSANLHENRGIAQRRAVGKQASRSGSAPLIERPEKAPQSPRNSLETANSAFAATGSAPE